MYTRAMSDYLSIYVICIYFSIYISIYLSLYLSIFIDCSRVVKKEDIEAIKWYTYTGVLGTEILGIWPKYSQVNDVNATDVNFDSKVIVTGDDFGLVKLFHYPSVKKGQEIMYF